MAEETSFSRWRKQQGFTQEDAAAALRVSRSQVANWDKGKDRATGKPVTPSYAIRCLMTNIAMDSKPTPWPE